MLELKNVTFGVEDADAAREIIRGVSFVVPDEQFVVITGPNGGGKSTLARLIMGIEKPSSGQILLDGQDITELGITERARLGISFALQQPVRFKGIRVVDLLRLAAGRELSVGDACEYLSADGQVRAQGGKDEILPELLKSTVPVVCNRILEGGVTHAD